ncbi:hypothetical protein Rhopal_002371-T1 [Rhodotorula paludigena]|uniref:Amino acid transporter transmembrane domain-containing protein n=1 Tax=Rhodotorula paludigena TaxID=86838 RepID=A0AAV5GAG1_9BASI|nr:hypothetical protein Rhopal_002371-T1 [Rhodotorula paludigena]
MAPLPQDDSSKSKEDVNLRRATDDAPQATAKEALGRDPESDGPIVDAVFGVIKDDGPNYRGLGWIVQLGLGILGLPSVMMSLGTGGGVLVIVAISALTTWANYVVVMFKLKHPEVYSMADIGYLMGGVLGREFLGASYWLLLTAVSGAGMLSMATAFNVMAEGQYTCTVVYAVVGAILTFLFSSIRTLDRISWIGWIGVAGIMTAILILTIAVGVQDRPQAAPPVGPWDPQLIAWGTPTFLEAMTAVSTVMFAFGGAPNFTTILAEMRRPEDFTKSLALCQSFVTITYLVIGCVVYHYCGIYVSSPALSSAGALLSKVCYGIALPGLIVGCVLMSHLTSKYTFLRVCGRTKHVSSNSLQSWSIWLAFVFVNVAISWVISQAIPFFGDLVSLIGALITAMLCMTTSGVMWLWLKRAELRTNRRVSFLALVAVNVVLVAAGTFIQVSGTVASIIAINKTLERGDTTTPFSC